MSSNYIPKNNLTLTEKQHKIANFYIDFTRNYGRNPTLEIIAKEFKISIPTSWQHLNTIKQKGYFNKICPTCGQSKNL